MLNSEKVTIKRGQSQVYLDYAERKRVRRSKKQLSLLTKVKSFDLRSVDSSFDSSIIYPLEILSPLIGAALKQGSVAKQPVIVIVNVIVIKISIINYQLLIIFCTFAPYIAKLCH